MTDVDRYLWHAGARLRFRDEGAGPAVLLIHGWTLDLEMWEPQAHAMKGSFRIIRHDRRGFGLSSGRPALADDVADTLAMCRHAGLERVAVLGTSQGARIAAQLAAGHPERVSCLVLDGVPPGIVQECAAVPDDIPMESYRALARSGGPRAFLQAWRRHPLVQLRTCDERMHELLDLMLGRYGARDLLESGLPAALPPLAASSIRCPCLVLSGTHDLASRLHAADHLARSLPCGARASVPEAGHMSNLDNPHAYNAIVLDFLQRFAR
jgi:pimeloyl-ACP methyl ester carboxylesterase